MIQVSEEKKEKIDKAMVQIMEAIKPLNAGDNLTMECPVCGGELVIYKPFKRKIAAKCKSDNCIRTWE